AINILGVDELSGLHWNCETNQLFAVSDNGKLYVLQYDSVTDKFSLAGSLRKLGSPEDVMQVDLGAKEFYTIDEKMFEIRRFAFNAGYSKCGLVHTWNLLSFNGGMQDTGNDGPEGIEFVPDSYLKNAGFVSADTGLPCTSKKGMGGLVFIAHQKKGLIWVYDVNPDKDDDFELVGKYKTSQGESCDLSFDRSTGLLYVLHNTDLNSLEVTDLNTEIQGGKVKFVTKAEYPVPNPAGGSDNIEGFAIMPKFANPARVGAWFCRDISHHETVEAQKDCLRWYRPVKSGGNEVKNWKIRLEPWEGDCKSFRPDFKSGLRKDDRL
ncbi:MAG TPA: hypothetical protein VK152_10655, partial [Paludibacter sp.]|nr:hypothetical protein [Paludibacter sp.]